VQVSSFNWAAVFQPRKLLRASGRSRRRPRFNWAAVFQPRKPSTVCPIQICSRWLQLGRGLSTAETIPGDANKLANRSRFNWAAVFQPRKLLSSIGSALRLRGASIGPRSFNRGNELARRASTSANWLQLGRGLSTAETSRR